MRAGRRTIFRCSYVERRRVPVDVVHKLIVIEIAWHGCLIPKRACSVGAGPRDHYPVVHSCGAGRNGD